MPVRGRDTRVRLDKAPNKAIAHAARLIYDGHNPEAVKSRWAFAVARERVRKAKHSSARHSSIQGMDVELVKAVEQIDAKVEEMVAADKKNPLKHLHVKPGAERAWDRFNKALSDAANAATPEERRKHPLPNCHGKPELYSDYDDDSIPTEEEAYALCFGCPLIELCAAFAEEEQPAWGVWAGEVFGSGNN